MKMELNMVLKNDKTIGATLEEEIAKETFYNLCFDEGDNPVIIEDDKGTAVYINRDFVVMAELSKVND